MHRPVLSRWFFAAFPLVLTCLLLPSATLGQPRPDSPDTAGDAARTLQALTNANAAVVGVRVVAADGARSIDTLGRRREGSGVVIDQDGLILTIGYLVTDADQIAVRTQDNKVWPARVVAYDSATGFGLVRTVLPITVAPATLGSTRDSKPGDALLVSIGAAGGDVAMTRLVSKRSFSGYWEYFIEGALFTTPPVANHSGAPLFNQKGELVGIGSLFTLETMGRETRVPGNMFVPIDLLRPILDEMLRTGTTRQSRRPWLGLSSSEQAGRVQIVQINKDSPAQAAGLQPGDVVLAVDDAKVATLEAFYKKLWEHADPTDSIKLTVLQGADLKTITLKAVDRSTLMRKPDGV